MPAGLFADWREDLRAVEANDPAARSAAEALLCHGALHAVFIYRLAHRLHTRLGLVILSRLFARLAHFLTGVEIHPGARIGERFFIDHGTGVVIGETAEIGDDCVIFHNVTVGGTGKHRGKRHPTVGNGVLIGTGATLLGPLRVGDNARVGAGAFLCMRDVPADCTVVGAPARLVKRDGLRVDEELARTRAPEATVPVAVPLGPDRSAAER